ncbi:hypothetical protein [Nocardioides marmoraquaticus]
MTRRTTTTRGAALASALVLATTLAGCGNGDATEPGGSQTEASPSADVEVDDDLLARPRQGVVLAGTDSEVSWRFPASYDATGPQRAESREGDALLTTSVGAKQGADLAEEIESLRTGLVPGTEADVEEESVGGKDVTFLTVGTDDETLRIALFQPEVADTTYAVFLRAALPLAEVPDERLEELRQMVGSVEVEATDG